MLKSVFNVVDKAPFSGKDAVHEGVQKYIQADTSKEKKRFAAIQALLGVYVVAHAGQAYIGGMAFQNHLENFQATNSPIDAAAMGIDAAYALINTAVTARQANLMVRMGSIKKKRSNNPEKRRRTESRHNYKHSSLGRGSLKAVAITLAGQALFLGSYFDAHAKEVHNECITEAADLYEQYTTQYGADKLIPIEDYQTVACQDT